MLSVSVIKEAINTTEVFHEVSSPFSLSSEVGPNGTINRVGAADNNSQNLMSLSGIERGSKLSLVSVWEKAGAGMRPPNVPKTVFATNGSRALRNWRLYRTKQELLSSSNYPIKPEFICFLK